MFSGLSHAWQPIIGCTRVRFAGAKLANISETRIFLWAVIAGSFAYEGKVGRCTVDYGGGLSVSVGAL